MSESVKKISEYLDKYPNSNARRISKAIGSEKKSYKQLSLYGARQPLPKTRLDATFVAEYSEKRKLVCSWLV